MAVLEHEKRFSDAVLERGGIKVRYRGFIDRVEVGCDERVSSENLVAAVDYKTSEGSTPAGGSKNAWTDGVVLQVPLYAHALSTHVMPGTEVARVEYRALKNPTEVHRLQLVSVEKKSGVLVRDDDARARYDSALDRVPEYVCEVRAGRFPPVVPESCNCPPWCHGGDICRSREGPKRGWR
jgi:hypothetical protein